MSPDGIQRVMHVSWGVVALAIVGVIVVVPGLPTSHLDDPNHWGVIGFGVAVLLLLQHERRRRPGVGQRRVLLAFLCGMPVVYLADWIRFGAAPQWLFVEIFGALAFWSVALLAVRHRNAWLVVGIAGHGLWDVLHYGRQSFVPDWYIAACVIADLALGIFAGGVLWVERSVHSADVRRVP